MPFTSACRFSKIGRLPKAIKKMHVEYCALLEKAGLQLPAHTTHIVEIPGRPVAVYIAQQQFAGDRLCHRRIHRIDEADCLLLIERVAAEIAKVWAFNTKAAPDTELAIDGQLSNWVAGGSGRHPAQLLYIDTSTPLMRKHGVEQQNPERLLKSAPGFLRWVIRWFFLNDVMGRYYVPRLVYTDLAANLFKEQRPELVPETVAIANRFLKDSEAPLTVKDIERYYAEDKRIWIVFLAFRRMDRWLTTRLLRRRYEFILPGPHQALTRLSVCRKLGRVFRNRSGLPWGLLCPASFTWTRRPSNGTSFRLRRTLSAAPRATSKNENSRLSSIRPICWDRMPEWSHTRAHDCPFVDFVQAADVDEKALCARGVRSNGTAMAVGGRAGGRRTRRSIDISRFTIVFQETVEIGGHKSQDQLLPIETCQRLADGWQEIGKGLRVHRRLDNPVHETIELPFTNRPAIRKFSYFKTHGVGAFHSTEPAHLPGGGQGNGDTRSAGPCGSTAAMGVRIWVIGKVVVDDMGYRVHIQATGGHVGGHQEPDRLLAEFAHDMVALGLAQVAVQRIGRVSLLHQGFSHGLGFLASAAEHQSKNSGRKVDNAFQPLITVSLVHQVTGVGDVGSNVLAPAQGYLLRVVQIFTGNGRDPRWHGG